jgi:hypothetical protein
LPFVRRVQDGGGAQDNHLAYPRIDALRLKDRLHKANRRFEHVLGSRKHFDDVERFLRVEGVSHDPPNSLI